MYLNVLIMRTKALNDMAGVISFYYYYHQSS